METHTHNSCEHLYSISLVPLPVSSLRAELSTTDNTTTSDVSWENPSDGLWDTVTIFCEPRCSPRSVERSASKSVSMLGLIPGQIYKFFAVASCRGINSIRTVTNQSLTMGECSDSFSYYCILILIESYQPKIF